MATLYVDTGYVEDGYVQSGITVYWGQKLIFIPKSELTVLQATPTEIRELNINTLRLILKDLEDDAEGMVYSTTHNHVAPISVGGVTLARVVELINNYTVTFEDGQYAVNIAGGNSNIADRVNVNQVSVRSANSAGLVQSREIEYASFDDGVHVDVVNGLSGTLYPIGTPNTPVNNMADALLIAQLRGFENFHIRGSLTLDTGDSIDGYTFQGVNQTSSFIHINPGAFVPNCRFIDLRVSGTLDGGSTLDSCVISNLFYIDGFIHDCILGPGMLQIAPGATPVVFLDCWASGDTIAPVVDLGGIGPEVAFRNYSGDLTLTNKTGGGRIVLDINVGGVILDSTITGGNIIVRGIGSIVDQSVGATVNTSTFTPNLVETAAHNLSVEKILKLAKIIFARQD